MRSDLHTEVELVAGDTHLRCWVGGPALVVDQWVTLADNRFGDRRWRVAQVFGTRREPVVEGLAVIGDIDPPATTTATERLDQK